MLGFQIQHVKKDQPSSSAFSAGPEALLFETCLRKIWILPESSVGNEETLHGADAYRFLLEVITGLQSPIFGETEILGQFRTFLDLNRGLPQFAFFQSWSRHLLEDAKFLRSTYFQGQGQHSYGSLLRKKLSAGENLWIVGAGQLTESLLPWLSEQSVTLWVRDTAKASERFPENRVASLGERAPAGTIVMIAAPLSETEIGALLASGQEWIDLREKTLSANLPVPRVSLMDLYRESSANQEAKNELKTSVLSRIRAMSEERLNRAWFRPQGWEDMCAS